MSAYVAFPSHLVEELLALLPPDARPTFAVHFERIAGNLVWVREDVQNAVITVLQETKVPEALVWPHAIVVCQELTEELMDVDNDALVALVQNGLTAMASDLVTERLRATQTVSAPAPETTGRAA